ncbi:hypothetical protein JCM8097_001536 [Rhodosporidiobolus ruineniae]
MAYRADDLTAALAALFFGGNPSIPSPNAPFGSKPLSDNPLETVMRLHDASKKPLGQLKRVNANGYSFVVDDPSGRVEYLFFGKTTGFDPTSFPGFTSKFPLGQILAVKEPMPRANPETGFALICTSALECIDFLPTHHPLLRGLEWAYLDLARPLPLDFDHKAHGNSLFKQKKWTLAAMAYSDGLTSSSSAEQKLLLHLNRAQAHLRLGNFASAYRDSSAVLDFLNNGMDAPPDALLKAKLRLARAYEGLRLLDKAAEAYSAVLEVDSSSVEGEEGKKRAEKMLREAQTGEYDMKELEGARDRRAVDTAVGDFLGPIEVVEVEGSGGGRGVVATRDIEAGEVLLGEKAFAIDHPSPDRIRLDFKLQHGYTDTPGRHVLGCAIASRMLDDPSTAPFVYGLYGDKQYPPTGTFPLGSLSKRNVKIKQNPPAIDLPRLEEIGLQNRFHIHADRAPMDLWVDSPSGLFLSASIFNHSCCYNADWLVLGDFMLVRARSPIRKGEEITVAYVDVSKPYQRRLDVCAVHFDDGCTCPLCQLDRLDGSVEVNRRHKLIEQRLPALQEAHKRLKKNLPPTEPFQLHQQQRDLASLVDDLEQTYSSTRGVLKPELSLPLAMLADFHFSTRRKSARKANELTLRSLEAGGAALRRGPDAGSASAMEVVAAPFVHPDDAAAALLGMAARLVKAGQPGDREEAVELVKAAREMASIVEGERSGGFAGRYKARIKELGLEEVVARTGLA